MKLRNLDGTRFYTPVSERIGPGGWPRQRSSVETGSSLAELADAGFRMRRILIRVILDPMEEPVGDAQMKMEPSGR
jgi:hypothetical protein